MARPTRQTITKAARQVNNFLAKEAALKALVELASDPQLRKKAKADPRGFLRMRGVTVPTSIKLTITVTGTICIRACTRVGPVIVCGQICVTGTITF